MSNRLGLPILIVIEFLITYLTIVSSQGTTRSTDGATEDNSTKVCYYWYIISIYWYIIGILLVYTGILLVYIGIYWYIIGIYWYIGLAIILLIILFISSWIKAKKKSNSDNTSTTRDTTVNNTTYKDEKFSDWFACGKKKKKVENSPQKGIMNEDTKNGKTKDTTFSPVTGEGGYSKYFDALEVIN